MRARTHMLQVENKPAAIAQAATDPDLVATCEGYVEEWCKQIEAVLTESEVVRKENDDIGPNAELEHWKSRMAKFNSITDQLKTLNVKIVVGIVAAAKSKKMEIWRALDTRITDAANEAKDNVKYLYTLERFAEPLYKSDPVQMVDAIPGLINAIKVGFDWAGSVETPGAWMWLGKGVWLLLRCGLPTSIRLFGTTLTTRTRTYLRRW